MQQVYASWVGIRQWSAGASKIISILDEPVVIPKIYSSTRKYDFKKEVEFKGIHFSYNQKSDHLLKDLNLKINRGDHIGIIGPTGSGKSTLVDILMGILKPTKGEVLIDGINLYSSSKKEFLEQWKLSISHVPQNIYLTDGSISENIAFESKIK